jgi:hypothetical protein
MTTSKTNALAKLLCDFCFETITGHESGFYKLNQIKKLPVANIVGDEMIILIKNVTLFYLNDAYKSLILKSDPYILAKFDAMCKINNHSEICLLNIIALTIINIHADLDRSQFDITSYDTYMKSVRDQLAFRFESVLNVLTNSISHTCTGIDISTCDPNEPMFF